MDDLVSCRLLELEQAYDAASYRYEVILVESPHLEEAAWLQMGVITSAIIGLLKETDTDDYG